MKRLLTALILLSIQIFAQQALNLYVLSEGGFSPSTSKLSMLELPENKFTLNIANPTNIGSYPDGMILHENGLYITEQGSFGGAGKIYELNTNGTIIKSKVVGTNPYSLAISNEKVYITNGPASNVSVLNLEDFSFVKNIHVGAYPQEIFTINNHVFVANTSTWGGDPDSTISVINSETDQIISTVVVRKDPSSLAKTNDGHLLIGCPGGESDGIIYKMDITTFVLVDSFSIAPYGFGKDISVDKYSNNIFFKSLTNNIVGLDISTGVASIVISDPSIIFTYGYSYDYLNKTHYVLDAKDFSSNGSLIIYSADGMKENTFETGIAPRRVVSKSVNNVSGINDRIIADRFSINQNYPNPFNPSTIISFSIPRQTMVKLTITNSIGQIVDILIDEILSPGEHEIKYDGSKLSSGLYFYRIQAEDFVSTRKMVLIK